MSSKTDVTYILKHISSGFYAKSSYGDLELTENKFNAKRFEPNESKDKSMWEKLTATGDYEVIKRTEVTTVSHEEVEFSE